MCMSAHVGVCLCVCRRVCGVCAHVCVRVCVCLFVLVLHVCVEISRMTVVNNGSLEAILHQEAIRMCFGLYTCIADLLRSRSCCLSSVYVFELPCVWLAA